MFEPGPMPDYDPYMCVVPLKNIIGRLSLMPCFLDGSDHPTVPSTCTVSLNIGGRKSGRCDTQPNLGNGSLLFEVNPWLWKSGRGMPRTMSVEEAEKRRAAQRNQSRQAGADTRKKRQAAQELRDHLALPRPHCA